MTDTPDKFTHKFLTRQGIDILRKDMGSDLVASVFSPNKIDDIVKGSLDPDINETDHSLFYGHFYDPETQKNYGGYRDPTAFTRFVRYYNEALTGCQGHATGWEFKLGKALHYFQDATCPFHAANDVNIPFIDTDHCAFESFAENHHDEMKVDYSDLYAVATAYTTLDFKLQFAALWAKDTYKRYNLGTRDDNKWRDGAKESLINSQKWIAALLYNFMMESEIKIPRHLINIALGKWASQSSTWGGATGRMTPQHYRIDELDEVACAAKAVDGCTNGRFWDNTVTHTNRDNKAWWQVDLGATYEIERIEIYNRIDSDWDRLKDFKVAISDEHQVEKWSLPHMDPSDPQQPVKISVPQIPGRCVMIQLNGTNNLHLAEVKVFQTPSP